MSVFPPHRSRRRGVAATVAVLALAACGGREAAPDPTIAREFRALLDAAPLALAPTPCPAVDAKRARLAPILAIAHDAAQSWHAYDQPLPSSLAQQLRELAPGTPVADELRCVIGDPTSSPAGWLRLGTIAALLERRGEIAAQAGHVDEAWQWVRESLRVHRDAPAQVYVYFFQPAWLLERATELARIHPPPPALRDALLATARAEVMPRTTLCAGLEDELLADGASVFYGHLTELRPVLIARWGAVLADLYTEDYAARNLASRDTWQRFRAVRDAVAASCRVEEPTALRRRLAPQLTELSRHSAQAGFLATTAVGRLDDYARLVRAEAAFRAELAGTHGPL